MHHKKRLVDSVDSFSPGREHWASKPPADQPAQVTVRLSEGATGILQMRNPRAAHWADILDRLTQAGRPAYVEIDEETSVITNLLIPEVMKVQALSTNDRGDVLVRLMPSHAIHDLLKSDPDFEVLQTTLQEALDAGTEVLVTETRDEHEIIDVRPWTRPSGDPPDPPPAPPDDPPVTEARAQELYDLMNAESCVPCSPSGDCIPFKYPDNGCWARAHKMCHEMVNSHGEDPEKVWIDAHTVLIAPTVNHPDCEVRWGWHVAPTLTVATQGGDEKRVIDPSLSPAPESKEEWKNRQGDSNATLRDSAWTEYWGVGTTDPDLSDTDYRLSMYRDKLKDRCLDIGPPPYSCLKGCFFIVDRSTFSNHEVEAMLSISGPAVVQAALYVVVDGFSPTDLGFTSATMQYTPTLSISPALQHMSVTPVDLVFEYPDHLNRRQRLTWIYDVSFTGTGDFTAESTTVTLQASLSTVSSTIYLYLIKQPNPYEIDGQTSWLSTDLRVFQIPSGESKFGVLMDSDPSAFISDVIANLNSGNTGGETFEGGISVDQQTSRLELSKTVDGESVYNFAVAKVRYRALSVSATDVRVFFRLCPVATTSLSYNQAMAYRRHQDSSGKVIPLLGIKNGEVAGIPCFAAPRVDSANTSMTEQTDPANVQTMPPNASGTEVVRYFGAWLDINQTEPQFPIQPSPVDGPWTTGRKTVQEHIRGAHQCLVSEIAFDPAPVPSGATPSTSDKIAQRNLAIVESANPGIAFSRRIPLTFEVTPSDAKMGSDELMIDWRGLPAGSYAMVYLPGVDGRDVLLEAAKRYRSHRLAYIDEYTVKCETGGITYLPLPVVDSSFPGMLTINLPEGVENGQAFTVAVRQVSGQMNRRVVDGSVVFAPGLRHVVGSFQITIPVRKKADILAKEERLLSNLRWIEKSIPLGNRWSPVFGKYVTQIAGRVDALGGKARKVMASPSGEWRKLYRRCVALGFMTMLFVVAFVVGIGVLPGGTAAMAGTPVAALLIGVSYLWVKRCSPGKCRLLWALTAGVAIGAVVLGVLRLSGVSTPQLMATIAAGAGMAALGLIASLVSCRSR